jgi:hyperosmotically inducible periplasmic protein
MNSTRQLICRILAATCLVAPAVRADPGQDARIEAAVRNTYNFRVHLKGDGIQVAARGGRVTLAGTVPNELHRTLAEETVAGLPGVKGVDNQLAIQPGAPSGTSDAWLALKVRTALLYHREVSSADTRVDVADGVVTLSGQASSQARKELAGEIAGNLEGVREVRNGLKVVAGPGRRTLGERIDDASVTAQVKAVLLGHRGTHLLATRVRTERGVVHLAGKAGSPAERELVSRLVAGVKGVRRVDNRMTLEP